MTGIYTLRLGDAIRPPNLRSVGVVETFALLNQVPSAQPDR